jgi:uncharacterized membrane protein YphA (DoxX/SURF4 family)
MTIWNLLIGFAIGGGILTALTGLYLKANKNWLISFLQNFTGVWFIFSGLVKAVDPMGTAIKMEQYFAAFETTIKGTSMKAIAPMFPWLGQYTLAFSIFMIILEIMIGIMLILGHKSKLTSWLFLLIMVFFTILTGYTHYTAYVPDGVNFFEFAKWGEYVETNMKVTDCGCFGDFLKLSPTTSFYKDIGLMPVTLIFLFATKSFHTLFTTRIRKAILWTVLASSIAYCLYYSFRDEPMFDFRPFKNGVNVREQRAAEADAAAKTQPTYLMTNAKTKEEKSLSMDDYLATYQTTYSKENGWAMKQVPGIPSVPRTKISDFAISNKEGSEVTDDLLTEKNYTFLVVSWKMLSKMEKKKIVVSDSIFRKDTTRMKIAGRDSFTVKRTFERIQQREEVFNSFKFDESYRKVFTDKINPILEKAEKAGYKIGALVPYADPKKIEDFRQDAQAAYPFFTADDLTIKTMIRSNPGLYLFKDGQIVHKWHINQLPDYETIKANYIK